MRTFLRGPRQKENFTAHPGRPGSPHIRVHRRRSNARRFAECALAAEEALHARGNAATGCRVRDFLRTDFAANVLAFGITSGVANPLGTKTHVEMGRQRRSASSRRRIDMVVTQYRQRRVRGISRARNPADAIAMLRHCALHRVPLPAPLGPSMVNTGQLPSFISL